MFDGAGFPRITVPQVVATAVGAVGPVLVLLGTHLSGAQSAAVGDLKVLALGLFGADAVVRVARNVHAAGAVRAYRAQPAARRPTSKKK